MSVKEENQYSEHADEETLRAKCETLFAKKKQRWVSERDFLARHEEVFGKGGEMVLRSAIKSGILYKGERGDLSLVKRDALGRGTLQISEDGYLSVRLQNGGDVSVRRDSSPFWKTVMGGDLVAVQLPRGRSRFGSVSRVIKKSTDAVIAEVVDAGRQEVELLALQPRMIENLKIRNRHELDLKKGDTVRVGFEPRRGKSGQLEPKIIGPGNLQREPQQKVEELIKQHNLRSDPINLATGTEKRFLDIVKKETMSSHRSDLRGLPFVTIDGATARDFDDALMVEKLPHGFRVKVAIADVAEFVLEGDEIDREAIARGTSVYFPNQVIPMLPGLLSDNLCSLRPDEDRLAVVVTMDLDQQGLRIESGIEEAIVRSKRRLTYTDVKSFMEGDSIANVKLTPEIKQQLELLVEVGYLRRGLRASRGGLDFDLPEPFIEIGMRGEVTSILRNERHMGHFLVEELMIAANETVAEMVSDAGYPVVYRVHPEATAEKRQQLESFLGTLGVVLPPEWGARDLQHVIDGFKGLPQQKTVQLMSLRCLGQASYDLENTGHWGLVSSCYCHFTSPIRRYPDLLVHRMTKRMIRRGDIPTGPGRRLEVNIKKLLPGLNDCERTAQDAERSMVRHLQVQYATGSLGEESSAMVVGVANFGLFVELSEPYCDGMVHVTSLGEEYWEFDGVGNSLTGRKSGRQWRLGDTLNVRIARVDLDRDRIDLVPVF